MSPFLTVSTVSEHPTSLGEREKMSRTRFCKISVLAVVFIFPACALAQTVTIGQYSGYTEVVAINYNDYNEYPVKQSFGGSGPASINQSPAQTSFNTLLEANVTASANTNYSFSAGGSSADLNLQGSAEVPAGAGASEDSSSVNFTVSAATSFQLTGADSYTDGNETYADITSSLTYVYGGQTMYLANEEVKNIADASSGSISAGGVLEPGITYTYNDSFTLVHYIGAGFYVLPPALSASDGSVLLDLSIGTPVPEPTSASLLAIGSLAMLRRVRRPAARMIAE